MKSNRILTILKAFAIVLLLIGGVLVSFPYINNFIFGLQQNKLIDDYVNEFSVVTEQTHDKEPKSKNKTDGSTERFIDLKKLKKDIKIYNREIYKNNQSNMNGTLNYATQLFNLTDYGFENNVYGYIDIPAVNIKMALLLGASEYNMSQGAVQLTRTSVPLGGKNTNAVIAGHCGYWGQNMFRYLSNLNNGDVVKVVTPFNTLEYSVTEKFIIEPEEFGKLKIQEGKDMITLFTCYPYPTNKQRCVIYCERITG
ncbi:MAG: class C sortase [Ruminococcus sp.]